MEFPRAAPELDPLDVALKPPRTPTRRTARYSPSLPNIFSSVRPEPRFYDSDDDILAFTAQRPHLGSLDLASPLLRNMPRVVRPSFDSAPITPPLTPESTAFSDVSTVDRLREVYKSPPQPQVSLDSPASPSHPAISLQGDLAAAQSQWAHRPAVIRSQSISFISRAASRLDSDPAFLLSLLNLPNAENSDHAAPPGRFLLVSGVPPKASSQDLRQAFDPCGDIRGIFVRFQAEHGVIILAFFDTRQCEHALHLMRSEAFFEGNVLLARSVSAEQLRQAALPRSEFIAEGEAELHMSMQTHVEPAALQHVLAQFGDLQSFSICGQTDQSLPQFRVEYFDCRSSYSAFSQLNNNRTVLDARVCVSFVDEQAQAIAVAKVKATPQHHSAPRSPYGDSTSRRVSTGSNSQHAVYARAQQSYQSRAGSLHHASSDQSLHARLRAGFRESLYQPVPGPQHRVADGGLPEDPRRQMSTLSIYDAGAPPVSLQRRTVHDRAERDSSVDENIVPPIPHADKDHLKALRASGSLEYMSRDDGRLGVQAPTTEAPTTPSSLSTTSQTSASTHTTPASSVAYYSPRDLAPRPAAYYEFDSMQRMPSWDEEVALHFMHHPPQPVHFPPPGSRGAPMHRPDQPLRLQAPVFVPAHAAPPGAMNSVPLSAYSGHPPRLPHINTSIESYYSRPGTGTCTPSSATPLTAMMDSTPPLTPSIFTPTEYANGAANSANSAERNKIDLGRVERGEDTRTTVMIKNIPNKMSDKNLVDFINEVCARRIDFLYLRMDFMNNCNVGYAFVNFMSVHDLLAFAKAKLGVKWNMFSSEKVLQMTYANYQGKEALVEKFKNSCIMDERESWRPKIFYSSGPNQGLAEPFPTATHLKRKERSQANARERVLYAHTPRHQRAQISPTGPRSAVYSPA